MERSPSRRDVLKYAVVGPATLGVLSESSTNASGATGNDWPQFQYDAANTGYNPDAEGPTGELTERWSFSTLGEVVSSPIVVDDTVYVGSKDGRVYALDAANGEKAWEYDTGADIQSSPVSDGTTIYIGNQDGTVFALSLDGVEEWTTTFDGPVSAALNVVDDRLFVPVDEVEEVVTLNSSNGTEEWRVEAEGAKPAVSDTGLFVTQSSSSGDFRKYDAGDGEELWEVYTGTDGNPPAFSTKTGYRGTAYRIVAHKSSDGSTRWEYDFSGDIYALVDSTSVSIIERNLYAGLASDSKGYVLSVDTVTGDRQWRVELPNSINSAPVLAGELIYFGCDDGNVYSLQQSDGEVVSSFETDAAVQSTAAISGGAIFVGSDDGYVYALEDLPPNEEPNASFTYSPSPLIAGREAEFGAVGSFDSDGSIENYTWDFDGNGATDAKGETVMTTFDSSGEYDVTLTVTDDRGATVSASQTVVVNQPPEPSFSFSPTVPNVAESVSFDATDSTDPDGSIDQLQWDFDDDGGMEAFGRQVNYTFSQAGDHLVTLSVMDDDGTARSVSQTVSVNEAPTAAFSIEPEEPGVDRSVTFDASNSSDPQNSIQSYEWDFGATGTIDATGQTATRQYDAVGEYTIGLRVIDANGVSDATQKTVSVVETPATPIEDSSTTTSTDSSATNEDGSNTISSAGGAETDSSTSGESTPDQTISTAERDQGDETQTGNSGSALDLDSIPVIGVLAGGATVLGGGALLSRRNSDREDRDEPNPANAEADEPAEELPAADSDLNADFEDFEQLELIGSGGSADVHKARYKEDGSAAYVALKTPRVHNYQTIDAGFAREFLSEAETWNTLDDHAHIVDVLDWGHSPQPWIAMEYMDDGSLREHLPLDIDRGIEVLQAVSDATQHAHRHGVSHGDLKPENVLFSTREDGSVVKVADWGLAKVLLDHSESTQGLSPAYAAPEQFSGSERDAKGYQLTDVYQLGALAYAVFTGAQPYEGSPAVIMNNVLNEQPKPPSEINPNLPEAVDDFVLKAMSKDPSDRYPTARHFRDALSEALESL